MKEIESQHPPTRQDCMRLAVLCENPQDAYKVVKKTADVIKNQREYAKRIIDKAILQGCSTIKELRTLLNRLVKDKLIRGISDHSHLFVDIAIKQDDFGLAKDSFQRAPVKTQKLYLSMLRGVCANVVEPNDGFCLLADDLVEEALSQEASRVSPETILSQCARIFETADPARAERYRSRHQQLSSKALKNSATKQE
eukprot:TRINITY_DN6018_c0_g1_i1.p1 TRINITY_DN6018_c0_g1~~TRINITY_DN6018_c0_g1_i1.p1  ORF type:complete len:197 (+),score=33.32 TRINITY_DN6018_c0_g1_i1:594-1184(+)